MSAIERLDLFADERFNSMEKLIRNIDAFRTELKATMITFTTDDLLARLHENDVPAARLLDFGDVFAHPQYAANDSVDVADHPQLGAMRRVKPPARFGGQRLAPASDSPEHGANTDEVLRELGYSANEIASMIADNIARHAD